MQYIWQKTHKKKYVSRSSTFLGITETEKGWFPEAFPVLEMYRVKPYLKGIILSKNSFKIYEPNFCASQGIGLFNVYKTKYNSKY